MKNHAHRYALGRATQLHLSSHIALGPLSVSKDQILKLAVIGGDGTGPEVTAEALKVLAAVAKLE